MSNVDAEQNLKFDENIGHGVSFTTYTWKRWQETLAHVCLRFTRFQWAIEWRQPQLVLAIATELQEVGTATQKEVGQWRGVSKK